MHKAARSAIAIVLTLVLSAAVAAAETAPDRFGTAWKPLRIGAGGYLTGMDISPDGSTRIVRADTYGAYIWNAARALRSKERPAALAAATELVPA